MNCGGCQYLGKNCGGVEGDPGALTVDPPSLDSRKLLEIACIVARIVTVMCDVAGPGATARQDEPPYIWDIKED